MPARAVPEAAADSGLHTIYTGPASGLRRDELSWEPDRREEEDGWRALVSGMLSL